MNSISGSSPRVRGAVLAGQQTWYGTGIIPACAGSSPGHHGALGRGQDHPRVCGEQLFAPHDTVMPPGSSPRVRGAVHGRAHHRRLLGIIPACAGSRLHRLHRTLPFRDHPRVCGEQATLRPVAGDFMGSSPRVRGAALAVVDLPRGHGIIPACAGSRCLGQPALARSWDHPRVCGEQPPLGAPHVIPMGSSPRVRGAVMQCLTSHGVPRIIPACAGSSCAPTAAPSYTRDHPRVCGEQARPNQPPHNGTGSSPRVRGAGFIATKDCTTEGIIPACAGSRTAAGGIQWSSWDHPRVCGEQRQIL